MLTHRAQQEWKKASKILGLPGHAFCFAEGEVPYRQDTANGASSRGLGGESRSRGSPVRGAGATGFTEKTRRWVEGQPQDEPRMGRYSPKMSHLVLVPNEPLPRTFGAKRCL